MTNFKAWIEAIRLRTLPVSVAGVLCAWGYSVLSPVQARWQPGALCLVFAILAQIASNFANEYYDFKRGADKAGRVGPRRGVTEGDIRPKAMRNATYLALAAACAVGCTLVHWGGWWLMAAGAVIAVGALAYSAGPYPLSRHALGEVAVIAFFGVVPVNLTYYIMCGEFTTEVFRGSVAIGLMGANVLIVNNYRDVDDDRDAGKMTLAVKFGKKAMTWLYLVNGVVAVVLMLDTWWANTYWWAMVVPAAYMDVHIHLYKSLRLRTGSQLNPLLGVTAANMLFYTIGFLIMSIIHHAAK